MKLAFKHNVLSQNMDMYLVKSWSVFDTALTKYIPFFFSLIDIQMYFCIQDVIGLKPQTSANIYLENPFLVRHRHRLGALPVCMKKSSFHLNVLLFVVSTTRSSKLASLVTSVCTSVVVDIDRVSTISYIYFFSLVDYMIVKHECVCIFRRVSMIFSYLFAYYWSLHHFSI